MAFAVVQIGETLQLVNTAGEFTELTLPSGVTLRTDVKPRFAVFNRYAVMVNTPSRPLTISGDGTVRLLTPAAPATAAVVSGASGGSLSGTYGGIKYTFIVFDDDGNIISESDYSPGSNEVTISSQDLKAENIEVSSDDISARRLYRPVTDGAVLFQWVDLDGNILTEIQDDLSDASLSLIASPVLGSAPSLTHIASFRDRLFGVGSDEIDNVRFTEAGIMYAWNADNSFAIPIVGVDDIGITAFLPRRDALGVGRNNYLAQITGSGREFADGEIDFDVVMLSQQLGVLSQESVAIYRDNAYFLWHDGVYEWGPGGITCISDGTAGKGNVRSWFASDDYFNRDRFQYAFGHVDPIRLKYRLFLASVEASSEDRWVEFDLRDRTWWGPHKTDLFTPTSVFTIPTDSRRDLVIVGGDDGNMYQEQVTRTDGESTAISLDVVGKEHDMGEPDFDKYWGQLTMFGKPQSGGDMTVFSRVGELEAFAEKVHTYDMTKARHSLLLRLGTGKHMELEFKHAAAGELVELYGYEVDEVHELGRR